MPQGIYGGRAADALARLVKDGDLTGIAKALAAGADPNKTDLSGATALMIAAGIGSAEAVGALLARSDPRTWGRDGDTALLRCADGDAEILRRLLPLSDAKRPDCFGRTALMIAAARGLPEHVAALLPASDVLARDGNGQSALDFAERRKKKPSGDGGAADMIKAWVEARELAAALPEIKSGERKGPTL